MMEQNERPPRTARERVVRWFLLNRDRLLAEFIQADWPDDQVIAVKCFADFGYKPMRFGETWVPPESEVRLWELYYDRAMMEFTHIQLTDDDGVPQQVSLSEL